LIADRAYDSDKLRSSLWQKGWDLVCPHRRGRKRKATQDGRKLRRYRRRWKIERTISWISQFRRLVVRYEHYSFIYQGFLHLACIMICLRKF
jgi:transposase